MQQNKRCLFVAGVGNPSPLYLADCWVAAAHDLDPGHRCRHSELLTHPDRQAVAVKRLARRPGHPCSPSLLRLRSPRPAGAGGGRRESLVPGASGTPCPCIADPLPKLNDRGSTPRQPYGNCCAVHVIISRGNTRLRPKRPPPPPWGSPGPADRGGAHKKPAPWPPGWRTDPSPETDLIHGVLTEGMAAGRGAGPYSFDAGRAPISARVPQ